jgi:hypothetical protein
VTDAPYTEQELRDTWRGARHRVDWDKMRDGMPLRALVESRLPSICDFDPDVPMVDTAPIMVATFTCETGRLNGRPSYRIYGNGGILVEEGYR